MKHHDLHCMLAVLKRKRLLLLAPAVALLATGCQTPPQDVPAALEAALLKQDRAAVLALIDRASQPLVQATLDSVAARKNSPYWLQPHPSAMHVVHTEKGDAGLVLTVESDGVKREWALVEEAGAWKVDLAGTASRRAWDVTYREAK